MFDVIMWPPVSGYREVQVEPAGVVADRVSRHAIRSPGRRQLDTPAVIAGIQGAAIAVADLALDDERLRHPGDMHAEIHIGAAVVPT
jgi:hypothetical protein